LVAQGKKKRKGQPQCFSAKRKEGEKVKPRGKKKRQGANGQETPFKNPSGKKKKKNPPGGKKGGGGGVYPAHEKKGKKKKKKKEKKKKGRVFISGEGEGNSVIFVNLDKKEGKGEGRKDVAWRKSRPRGRKLR